MAAIVLDEARVDGTFPPTGIRFITPPLLLMTTDKGREDAAGHSHPPTAALGRTGRVPEAAGQRVGEGHQTERARGQRGQAGRYRLISPTTHP